MISNKILWNISLIIPSCNDHEQIQKQFKNLTSWKVLPNEIIIVDSSDQNISIEKIKEISLDNQSIKIKIIHKENLYPGHARNIGIKNSKNDILAFLDASTHPSDNWLSSGVTLLKKNNSYGVWGKTYYEVNNYKSRIIRASTYGVSPIRTLPGSIIKKDVFLQCGFFIESVRSGEDADWISRVKLHKIYMENSFETLKYYRLNNIKVTTLIKKWFRNYSFGSRLAIYSLHRDIYLIIFFLVSIISAYNWNNLLASWDLNSIFYIPNITKISLLIFIVIYLIIRGILLPLKKREKIRFILPFNFLIISALSISLDLAKLFAFLSPKKK